MNKNLHDKKIKSGLVFGKFMPLHEGHVYLMNFAQASCERLTILVCTLPAEPIPGELRYQWVKEMFPNANVVHHNVVIPQYPNEHPDFWNIWKNSIETFCPGEKFDALFGSEDYGWKMAQTMGITYIPVNTTRNLVPVSATKIRNNPMKYWKFIPTPVKPYFVKRVRIVGPESTGKTTLAKILAEKFDTLYVDEYARKIFDEYVAHNGYKPGEFRYDDFPTIARGQRATENALARIANRVLFCDTDLTTTVYWNEFFFKRCQPWIRKEAGKQKYDLTLLLSPDVSYTEDAQRVMPNIVERKEYFNWWKRTLEERNDPFIVISGSWQVRIKTAVTVVAKLLKNNDAHCLKTIAAKSSESCV